VQLKPQPNRQVYLEALRRLGPEGRLLKAFELTEMTHEALRAGLRHRHPDATLDELDTPFRERLERCRSRSC